MADWNKMDLPEQWPLSNAIKNLKLENARPVTIGTDTPLRSGRPCSSLPCPARHRPVLHYIDRELRLAMS